ncbi:uncharacterized protein PpBr36_10176 [Pyricularia pennisetigena]|uniref:uncharacterized protein n=1 Tax=Pyricularia pennisetigena TaxID=1578925 RepID=UPI0011543A4A|nr:uncharacterized protein PpBr36_10176 [Pyricularia pennisetigena]TLS21571.1 hypothetical protein PpBr36_10176 [Pyricularia pennisetigena]
MHELFDQRLITIHPDSHLIRIFAPYDFIIPYHGKKANFGSIQSDRNALRWHWNMCVIENMGASTSHQLQGVSTLLSGSLTPLSRLSEMDESPASLFDDDTGPTLPHQGPAGWSNSGGGQKRSRLSVQTREGAVDDYASSVGVSNGEKEI